MACNCLLLVYSCGGPGTAVDSNQGILPGAEQCDQQITSLLEVIRLEICCNCCTDCAPRHWHISDYCRITESAPPVCVMTAESMSLLPFRLAPFAPLATNEAQTSLGQSILHLRKSTPFFASVHSSTGNGSPCLVLRMTSDDKCNDHMVSVL